MTRAFLALLLVGCSGGDFAAAAAADVDAGELVDAGAELGTVDHGAELERVDADAAELERVDVDAGAELVDVAGELVADAAADMAEAGPPPLVCKSIDGTGQCAPAGPWPWICCRTQPCECCNKPQCGAP